MYYWICIRANKGAGLFGVNTDTRVVPYGDFEYIKSECNMQYAETVSFEFCDTPYMMLVDEEGKLQGKEVNQLASMFYSWDTIVGDVAILAKPSNDEMMYLLEDDATKLFKTIKNAKFGVIDWGE